MALPLESQFEEPLGWARQFGTANQDDADGLYTDGRDTYVVGFVTVAVEGRSRREAYLAKYGERGRRIWYRQYSAMLDLYAKAVTGDATGIYVAGYGMGKAYLRKFSVEGTELANTPIDFGGSANVAWGIARDSTRDETFQFGSKGYDTVRALSAESGRFAIAGQVFGGALPTQRDLGSGDAFVIRGEY